MKDELLERFLRYVKINTMSKEGENKTPSTNEQFDLANILKQELEDLGLTDIKLTDECILTAYLKSNTNSNLHIGFIAHLDTIPGFSGKNVKPNVIYNYDAKDINLTHLTVKTKDFPFLKKLKGKTLITTDGSTVLGGDDKAGIAEIMNMLSYFKQNPNIKHHHIHVAFTPDEEIGGGIANFDVKGFNCDYAYTVDGGLYNEICYSNFNASSAVVTIKGLDIHPGSAKGHMLNASLIALEYQSLLPTFANPMYTEGLEGFIHLCSINGEVGQAKLEYIIREHDIKKLHILEKHMKDAADFLNKKYLKDTVSITITPSYLNMYEIIKKDKRSITRALNAMKKLNITPLILPIRGGTDGAKLTQMGLNTPNLGTGSYNGHGPYELACLEEMQIVSNILIQIASI